MQYVTADTLISTVLGSLSGAVEVFERHGLGCAGCLASSMESMRAVSTAHDVDLETLLRELNQLDGYDCASTEGES